MRNAKVGDNAAFCITEFEIQILQYKATRHLLEIPFWKKFGAGRSLDDPKWEQHTQFARIPYLHVAKFSPASIKSTFELNWKSTKSCKTLFATSKETDLFYSSKKYQAEFVLHCIVQVTGMIFAIGPWCLLDLLDYGGTIHMSYKEVSCTWYSKSIKDQEAARK